MGEELGGLIHHRLVSVLLETGRMLTIAEIGRDLALDAAQVVAGLRDLARSHGVVLHPNSDEPWIVHPFSGSPTAVRVQCGKLEWWAPCLWCACGIAALADRDVGIHARIADEGEPLHIHVRDGDVVERDLWVHFSCPPRDAWIDVHHFCATVQAFRRLDDAERWSVRYGHPLGAVLPLPLVMELGRRWYGRHADSDWRKWTLNEAADIFASLGLTGPFWDLPSGDESF